MPSDTTNIRINDTQIWGIHPHESIPIKRYDSLPDFVTNVEDSYDGTGELTGMVNYSSNYHVRFSTFHKLLQLDIANLTGDIYQISNGQAKFDGTLLSTLGDDEFHIEHTIGNQKIVFTTAVEAPAAPTGLEVAPDDGAVVLRWDDPSDSTITKYQVRHASGTSVPANTAWTNIDGSSAATTSHTVTGLTNGTRYAFEIRAVGRAGNSEPARTTGTPDPVPVPQDFKVELSSGRDGNLEFKPFARLTWTRGAESAEVQFKRKRQVNPDWWVVSPWTNVPRDYVEIDNPYWLEAVEWDTTYEYEIRYLRNDIPGPSTGRIRVTTPDPPGPGLELAARSPPATDMELNETGRGFRGSWEKYRVRLTTKPAGNVTLAITSSDTDAATVSPSTLTFTPDDWDGSLHVIYVFGVDNDKVTGTRPVEIKHSISATSSPDDYPTTLELPSAHVRILDDEIGIVVSPTEVTLDEDGTATFDVKLSTESVGSAKVTVASADPTAATVSPAELTFTRENWDTLQTVTVTGVDDSDGVDETTNVNLTMAAYSASVSVTVTDDDEPPGAPSNLQTTAGDRQVTLTWMAAPGEGITKYQVTHYKGSTVPADTVWVDVANGANATTHVVTELDNGDEYTFQVRAVNGVGSGAAASATATPVLQIPGAPTDLSATVGDAKATFAWTLPTNASEIDNVQVRWKKTSDLPFVSADAWDDIAGTATNYTATDLDNGIGYTFEVRAVNTAGNGTAASTTATPDVTPNAPTDLTAEAGDTKVTLTWTLPTNAGKIDKVQWRHAAATSVPPETGWDDLAADATSVEVINLTNGTQYAFEVRAVNTAGNSAAASTTATPDVTPNAPTDLTAEAGDTKVTLTWTLPTNAGKIDTVQWRHAAATLVPPETGWDDLAANATSVEVINLTNGTQYAFEVRAVNTAGNSATASTTATPDVTPNAPTDLTAEVGDTKVTLTWTLPTNAGKIDTVQWRHAAAASVPPETGWDDLAADATSVEVINLTNGTQYAFEVRAVNTAGNGTAASTTATPDVTPNAPTDLTAEVGDTKVTLNWALPINASRISNVQVRWKKTSDLPFVSADAWDDIAGTATNYTATDLDNGIGYTFEVRAVNTAGNGTAASTTATPDVTPNAPTDLTAEAGDTKVTLTWTLPTNAGKIDTVQWRHAAATSVPPETGWDDLAADATSVEVINLTNGTQYTFEVRAMNTAGNSAAASTTATPDVTPNAPTDLTAEAGDTKVTLTWTLPTNAGKIDKVQWRRAAATSVPPETGWDDLAANATSVEVINLTNGTQYAFEVRAVNTAGNSATASTTATPDVTPNAPTDLTAEAGDTKVTLTWTLPTNAGKIDKVQWRHAAATSVPPETGWDDLAADATSVEVINLTNGTQYAFEVRAVNTAGNSAAASTTATPDVTPNAPTDLTAEAGDTKVTLTWTLPTNAGKIDTVQWRRAAATSVPPETGWDDLAADATSVEVINLTNGTQYAFEVRAVNTAGNSAAASTTATPDVTPNPPTDLTAEAGDTKVTLTWTLPTNAGKIDTVQWRHAAAASVPPETGWDDLAADATSVEAINLTNGTQYAFEVRAVNTAGNSAAASTTATPDVTPNAPTDLTAEVGDTKVTLTWTLPTNAGKIDTVQWRHAAAASVPPETGWDDLAADATSVEVINLTNGTQYAFEVRAVNTAGNSAAASTTATPDVTPNAPTDLTAEVGDTKVTLTWTLPTNAGKIDTVQWRHAAATSVPPETGWDDLAANATSVEVINLTNGTQYAFEVRAVNTAGNGTVASTTAIPDVMPNAPSNLTAGVGDKVVRLAWTAPSGRVTGYEVRYGQGTSVPSTTTWTPIANSASATDHTVTNLVNGSTYAFEVRAVNTAGGGTASATVTATLEQPVATLSLTSELLGEGDTDSPVTVTVTLDRASNAETKITVSATPEAEATLSANRVLTIAAGATQSTGTVTITPIDDVIDSPDKKVTVSGEITSGNWVTAPPSKEITVTDDEDQPTVTLVLTPNRISEDSGVATVTARLDPASSETTTITVSAVPVSPAVDGDFTLSGNTTLTVPAGTTTSTGEVTITANDNKVDAPDKRVTVAAEATNAHGVGATYTASLTIVGDDAVRSEARRQVAKTVLAKVARTALSAATDVIDLRFAATSDQTALTLAGWKVGGALEPKVVGDNRWRRSDSWDRRLAAESRGVDGSALWRESSFVMPLGIQDEASNNTGPAWTVWSRGDWRQFEGPAGAGTHEGSLSMGWLGADARVNERHLAGLAVSRSESESDYRADDNRGRIETSLAAVWPYVQMTTRNGGKLQLVLGAGHGDVEHQPEEGALERAGMNMLAGSVGGRFPSKRWGRFTTRTLGSASMTQAKTNGSPTRSAISGLTATSWRLRVGVEAEHDGLSLSTGSDWLLRPRGGLTLRQDGGDGTKGTGMEVNGSVRLSAPSSRFGLDAGIHWLALHSENATREWGASLEASLAPAADGRGPSLAFGHTWGQQQNDALSVEQLFDQEYGEDTPQRQSLNARAGYGFGAAGGLLTPFVDTAFHTEPHSQDYQVGVSFTRNRLDAALTTGHRKGASPETRIEFNLQLRY